jgi:hypothetical protein
MKYTAVLRNLKSRYEIDKDSAEKDHFKRG